MREINLMYCSRFKHLDCYFIKDYNSFYALHVVFHAKKATKKNVFSFHICKANGKYEFTLISHNVSAKYDYCFDYRFENDINALFEGGTVYAAQRLLISLIRNSLV